METSRRDTSLNSTLGETLNQPGAKQLPRNQQAAMDTTNHSLDGTQNKTQTYGQYANQRWGPISSPTPNWFL